jgi:ABC-type lipoprotein release transport system permease subunit
VAVLRLAWRNLWRNGRRTAITLAMVATSTAVLLVMRALMQGLLQDAVRNATDLRVGEVQAHAPEWLADRSFYRALPDPDATLATARAAGVAAAPRSYGYGLAARGVKSAGALFWGVDPAAERDAFELARHVARGGFLGGPADGGVVLGRTLARSLDAGVGDEVVVVVQAADGSLGNELLTVRGVLEAVDEATDRSAALVHRADFDALFVGGGRVHEIAFNSRGRVPLEAVAALAAAAAPGQDVRTWRQLLPALSDMLAMMDAWLWIFGTIFFLAAGLGVMNTMLMATHERVHEFGLQKALGSSPWRIVRDVAAEALTLGVVGTAAGAAFGAAAAAWLRGHGIDTSALAGGIQVAGVAFDPVWRAAPVGAADVVGPVVATWAVAVLAALYPASIAARLDPVVAMHQT